MNVCEVLKCHFNNGICIRCGHKQNKNYDKTGDGPIKPVSKNQESDKEDKCCYDPVMKMGIPCSKLWHFAGDHVDADCLGKSIIDTLIKSGQTKCKFCGVDFTTICGVTELDGEDRGGVNMGME